MHFCLNRLVPELDISFQLLGTDDLGLKDLASFLLCFAKGLLPRFQSLKRQHGILEALLLNCFGFFLQHRSQPQQTFTITSVERPFSSHSSPFLNFVSFCLLHQSQPHLFGGWWRTLDVLDDVWGNSPSSILTENAVTMCLDHWRKVSAALVSSFQRLGSPYPLLYQHFLSKCWNFHVFMLSPQSASLHEIPESHRPP